MCNREYIGLSRGYVQGRIEKVLNRSLGVFMKTVLSDTQWACLWVVADDGRYGEIDRLTLRAVFNFKNSTINSLIRRGLLGYVNYANGVHINITDLGSEYLAKFSEDV